MLTLSRQLAVLTQARRDDPRTRRLFPAPAGQAMRGIATAEQDRIVRTLIATLREDPELESLRNHADALQQQLDAVDAARQARAARYVPEGQGAGRLRGPVADRRGSGPLCTFCVSRGGSAGTPSSAASGLGPPRFLRPPAPQRDGVRILSGDCLRSPLTSFEGASW
ncbi:MAG: hypothetical protein AB1505_07945 [Candidatus Latescibacterota bacterium]